MKDVCIFKTLFQQELDSELDGILASHKEIDARLETIQNLL